MRNWRCFVEKEKDRVINNYVIFEIIWEATKKKKTKKKFKQRFPKSSI